MRRLIILALGIVLVCLCGIYGEKANPAVNNRSESLKIKTIDTIVLVISSGVENTDTSGRATITMSNICDSSFGEVIRSRVQP
jgi:hypothetical protein